MSILKYFPGCMIAAFMLVSCDKNESYDIKGDPVIKFFTNHEAPGNAPPNSISYAVVNIPNTAGSGWVNHSTTLPAAIKFPVLASRPVNQAVTIGAALDNSLVEAYNAAHHTDYLPFPAGMLNTEALAATIAAGADRSADSITINTDQSTLNALTGKAYMAPIVLKTVSNTDAGAITNNPTIQVTYIVLNVEQRQIIYDAPAADAQGTLIADRSTWTATLTPEPATTFSGGSILDGSNTSYSRWAASPGQVDVNMQATQQLTGIRLRTTTSSNQIPTQVEVYLSNDGINYDLIGSPMRSDLAFESGYNYILFYQAIPAKYIRLRLSYSTSGNSQNRRITELDVYAN